MTAKELEGKVVLRTGPIYYSSEEDSADWSYCSTPVEIVKVTDSHIYYVNRIRNPEGNIDVLDARWLDDKWIEFEPAIQYN